MLYLDIRRRHDPLRTMHIPYLPPIISLFIKHHQPIARRHTQFVITIRREIIQRVRCRPVLLHPIRLRLGLIFIH